MLVDFVREHACFYRLTRVKICTWSMFFLFMSTTGTSTIGTKGVHVPENIANTCAQASRYSILFFFLQSVDVVLTAMPVCVYQLHLQDFWWILLILQCTMLRIPQTFNTAKIYIPKYKLDHELLIMLIMTRMRTQNTFQWEQKRRTSSKAQRQRYCPRWRLKKGRMRRISRSYSYVLNVSRMRRTLRRQNELLERSIANFDVRSCRYLLQIF